MSRRYKGDAWITPTLGGFYVTIEASNFRGEVHITKQQAKALRDDLIHRLSPSRGEKDKS